MKTLTVTQARAGLGKVCERVRKGEEIGIIWGNQIFMLLPVEIEPSQRQALPIIALKEEYLEKEYNVTPKEFEAFKKREKISYRKNRRKGNIVSFKGKFNPSVLD